MSILSSMATAADPAPAPRYMGTGSCSSSNCHGSVAARTSSGVLQNEYYSWQKHDRHAKAYAALQGEEGRRMANLLGLGPATEAKLCLKCHATPLENSAEKGEKFQLEDGVSCEACHGAGGGWLDSHAVSGATHDQNVARGMTDLVPLDKRAEFCLSCHFGTDDKTVNHRLYGAGHPRLTFELDTFSVLQPRHWNVDEDYVKRKGGYIPARAWLVGQAVQAKEFLEALQSPARAKNGIFPELSIFDCYSCHHSLTEGQWKSRTYGGHPGELRLNAPGLLVLRAVARVLTDSSIAADYSDAVDRLLAGYVVDGQASTIQELHGLIANRLEPAATQMGSSEEELKRLLDALIDAGSRIQYPRYEAAEQIAMGIQAVLASSPALSDRYKHKLDQLYSTLGNEKSFKPEPFISTLKSL